jgi:hypothetical protein
MVPGWFPFKIVSRSGQTKVYKTDICCFSTQHPVVTSKTKDWLVLNQDNVYEWSDIFTEIILKNNHSLAFNNNISWRSVLLVEETGENHLPGASHWQTLSHNVLSNTPRHEQVSTLTTLVVIGTDCIGNYKSNYHMIMTISAPCIDRILNKLQIRKSFLI